MMIRVHGIVYPEFKSVKNRQRTRERMRRLSFETLQWRLAMAGDPSVCTPHIAPAKPFIDAAKPFIDAATSSIDAAKPSIDAATSYVAYQPSPDDEPYGPLLPRYLSAFAVDAAFGEMPVAATEPIRAAASSSGSNPLVPVVGISPYDSSREGTVTSLDALLVLNHLGRVQGGAAQNDAAAVARFDANRDSSVSPADANKILFEMMGVVPSGSILDVPQVTISQTPTSTTPSLVVSNLGMALTLQAGTTKVFGSLLQADGTEKVNELSSLISGTTLQLPQEELITRLSPTPNKLLRFSFWTGNISRVVRSFVELTWNPPTVTVPPNGVTLAANAESATPVIIDQTHASYPLIQSIAVSQGTKAFHLAHPTTNSESFVIGQTVRLPPTTKLFFMSRLGYAMPNQIAKVQMSLDGGTTWSRTLYSQSGSGGEGETGFVLRSVDLSAYAYQEIRLRFLYEWNSGSWYKDTLDYVGWVIDDIQLVSNFVKSQYSIGNPSNQEQWALEYVNRARANASAEADRLASETDPNILQAYSQYGVTPANIRNQYSVQIASGVLDATAQPLSFNAALMTASELHSQDMFNNQFQDHTSRNPPAPLTPGMTATQRTQKVGYYGTVSENIFAYARSVPFAHAAFAADWGGDSPGQEGYNPAFAGQGMQNPAGHRINLHKAEFNEIGIGIVEGTNGPVGPQVQTVNMSSAGGTYITGVAYRDANRNGFYDIGEGLPGVRVDADNAGYFAITASSGGYSIPVNDSGRYVVTFTNGQTTSTRTVDLAGGLNVKVDYVI